MLKSINVWGKKDNDELIVHRSRRSNIWILFRKSNKINHKDHDFQNKFIEVLTTQAHVERIHTSMDRPVLKSIQRESWLQMENHIVHVFVGGETRAHWEKLNTDRGRTRPGINRPAPQCPHNPLIWSLWQLLYRKSSWSLMWYRQKCSFYSF